MLNKGHTYLSIDGKTKRILEKKTIVIQSPLLSSADILLLMRQHHYYYCYDDSPRCLIRNYEKSEVLVTSCCSYNNHLRLALTNLPFLHLCLFLLSSASCEDSSSDCSSYHYHFFLNAPTPAPPS